jgi:hypothetical protein
MDMVMDVLSYGVIAFLVYGACYMLYRYLKYKDEVQWWGKRDDNE